MAAARTDIPLFTVNYDISLKWPSGFDSITLQPRVDLGDEWTFPSFENMHRRLEQCNTFSDLDTFMMAGTGMRNGARETIEPVCTIKQRNVMRDQVTLSQLEVGDDLELYECLLRNEYHAQGFRFSPTARMYLPMSGPVRMLVSYVDVAYIGGYNDDSAMYTCQVYVNLHAVNAFRAPSRDASDIFSPTRPPLGCIVSIWLQLLKNGTENFRLTSFRRYFRNVEQAICATSTARWTSASIMRELSTRRGQHFSSQMLENVTVPDCEQLDRRQMTDLKQMLQQENYTFECLQWQPITTEYDYSYLYNTFRVTPRARGMGTCGGVLSSFSGTGKTRTCIYLALTNRGPCATLVVTRNMSMHMWERELEHVAQHRLDAMYHVLDGDETVEDLHIAMRRNVIVVCTFSTYKKLAFRSPAYRLIVDDAHCLDAATASRMFADSLCFRRWAVTASPIVGPPNYRATRSILSVLKIPELGDALMHSFDSRKFPARLFTLIGLVSVHSSAPVPTIRTQIAEVEISPRMSNIYNGQRHRLVAEGVTQKGFDEICYGLSKGSFDKATGMYRLLPKAQREMVRFEEMGGDQCCGICYDPIKDPVVFDCGNLHTVCFNCSERFVTETNCPFCRGGISSRNFRLYNPLSDSGAFAPKFEHVLTILNSVVPANEKVVILTRFKGVVKELHQFLRDHVENRKIYYVQDRMYPAFTRDRGPAVVVARYNGVSSGVSFVSEDPEHPCRTVIMFEPPIGTVDLPTAMARITNQATATETAAATTQATQATLIQLVYKNTVESRMHYFHTGMYDHNHERMTGHRFGLSTITSPPIIRHLLA